MNQERKSWLILYMNPINRAVTQYFELFKYLDWFAPREDEL